MFRPPFCPQRNCGAHITPPKGRWYVKNGSYLTRCHGSVQRYRCLCCGADFSGQSFSIDYYAKRLVSYRLLKSLQRSCAGIRQSARALHVHRGTILNKIMRLSREALAAHARLLEQLTLGEDLASDGLESYWKSQYLPNNFNILMGADSRFLLDWDAVTLRRSGSMTAVQRQRRAEIEQRYRPDPKAVYHSFQRLLDTAAGKIEGSPKSQVTLITDYHKAYRRALRDHLAWQYLCKQGRVVHCRISSRKVRNSANPLNPVNVFDRQIRTDLAEHVRETIRFARNRAHSLERFAVWAFDYNYCKRFRINQSTGDMRTHAEAAGLPRKLIAKERRELCLQRTFLSRTELPPTLLAMWLRTDRTPLKTQPEYLPYYLAA